MQQIAAKGYNIMKTLNTDLAAIQLTQVIEQLEQLLFCDLVLTYNDYASANHYEMIHDNDEDNINTLFNTPYEAAQAVVYGKYNPNDDYVMLDGYSNAISFSYQLVQDDNCPIDISELSQWLISEDKLAEYDITVTTLDDMLASIEDNITDDEMLLNTVCQYLHLNHITLGNEYSFDEKVNTIMELINGFNCEQLNKLITDLNINYQ